ncbi:similar to Naumovozyma castellii NCAS_0C03980 hypothetical protein [Maudiozyma barnettii]|uniref:Uncharacterized protein n=1 Tax=Maudiozyma barnettii TaxID=61262 RepID=A0A8H2VBX0_9SACH|nr:uncharacterized protein KABA2_01S13706 [Kazachstania barnettii]CAB4252442.1 similar to Naumovozyma castellii NCAS_0C03980 hypothetical protein [Kazachstania barnettii]CAD1779177.1 similar to Naumovozyma castellii NCAS_0C03980 hypothetical protein [Kazachstania barnettii]
MSVIVNGAEDRVFGEGPFKAYPMVGTGVYSRYQQLRTSVSPKLVVVGCLTAVSSFIVFLLGVHIVIQYRTIQLDMRLDMLKKLVYIVLSILAIIQVIRLIAWVFDNWSRPVLGHTSTSIRTNHSGRRRYSRLATQ